MLAQDNKYRLDLKILPLAKIKVFSIYVADARILEGVQFLSIFLVCDNSDLKSFLLADFLFYVDSYKTLDLLEPRFIFAWWF